MKKRNSRVILSLLLVVAMTVALLPLSVFGSEAKKFDAMLEYRFEYSNSGYAEGTVILRTAPEFCGGYYLYWADNTAALLGYDRICTLDTSSGGASFRFSENVAIPPGATKLIAIKSETEPADRTVAKATAVYEIPETKRPQYSPEQRLYTFQTLSDVHNDEQSSVYYTYAKEHFAQALENAADRAAEMVLVCGDCISNYQNGTSKEWAGYQKIIADSSYCNPIYESVGNHEMKSDVNFGLEAFKTATGLATDTETNGDKPYYSFFSENGDLFIMMALEKSTSPNEADEFSAEQLEWVRGLIKDNYSDHNIFIFEHALFRGYGAGDSKTSPYYEGSLRDTFPSTVELKSILEQYPDVFMFSGHTHIDLSYEYNYDTENGTSANMFHIPSTACSTNIVNGALDYTMNKSQSQCYFVDVYEDTVIVNGTDNVKNLILPQYVYLVDQSGQELTAQLPNYHVSTLFVNTGNAFADSNSVFCLATGNYGETNSKSYGREMTKIDTDSFSLEVPSDYTNLVFYIDTGSGYLRSTDFTLTESEQHIVLEGTTVYYRNTSTWDEVYAYVWSDAEKNLTFPGLPMTQTSEPDIYELTFPAGVYENIIFSNNGQSQTKDLKISDYLINPPATADEATPDEYTGEMTQISVNDATSTAYLFTSGAVLYIYDNDTGKYYEVDSATKTVSIPVITKNITLYRCNGAWSVGNKTDSLGISFWNSFGPVTRADGNSVLKIVSSSSFSFISEESDGKVETGATFYLMGYINGADYTGSDYEFKNGKTTLTVTEDSYLFVQSSFGTRYMTNGWLGFDSTSATLYKSGDNKLYLAASTATVTLTVNTDGTVTISYETVPLAFNKCDLIGYPWGDADLSSNVNVKDATVIQKHTAKLTTIGDEALALADVNGDSNVNIKDATLIQKFVARIVPQFPAEQTSVIEPPDITVIGGLMQAVSDALNADYRYASYNAYMAMKKAYRDAVSAGQDSADYAILKKAYDDFVTLKQNNNIVNVYLCDSACWGNSKAYITNSETGAEINPYDGTTMSFIRQLDSGHRIYLITVNQSKWDKVVFANNLKKTDTLNIPTENYSGYYTSALNETTGVFGAVAFTYRWVD